MGRFAVPLAVAILLAVGCASVEQPVADAAPQYRPAPDGFRRHTVREAGISVALPIGFQVLGQRDAALPRVYPHVREVDAAFPGFYLNLVKLDQSFRGPIAALASPESPLKLFAFDRVFW